MTAETAQPTPAQTGQNISLEQLLTHWQGHRALTRKAIEAFPEKELFTFSIGGMRTFSELVIEMLEIAYPGAKGAVTGEWNKFGMVNDNFDLQAAKSKAELLRIWDWTTRAINEIWPGMTSARLQQRETAFEIYQGVIWEHIMYFVDNEIHHRGQGYVYLRALGIEPPPFWERG